MNKTISSGLLAAGLMAAGLALAACSSDSQSPAGQISQGAKQMGQGISAAASDTAITTKVKTGMAADTGLNSFHIHISTTNGVVTLTGTVDSAATRDLAGQVAAQTGGVVRVDNDLKVKGG